MVCYWLALAPAGGKNTEPLLFGRPEFGSQTPLFGPLLATLAWCPTGPVLNSSTSNIRSRAAYTLTRESGRFILLSIHPTLFTYVTRAIATRERSN